MRRFRRGCLAGGGLAMLVLAWLVTRGGADLFPESRFGDFYDEQARALFHGHWDMPSAVLGAERFNVDGRYYTYFGPTPSLLRMPVLLVTDRFDGRLGGISVLAGCAVAVVAIAWLAWSARCSVRGTRSVSVGESVVAAALVLVAACGTMLPYLAGWVEVYHEAIVWGVALALLSYAALVAWTLLGRARDLVIAAAAAALSVLARGSVGFGPIAAIGLVLLVRALRAWRGRATGAPDWRVLTALATACGIPFLLYVYVNVAKFGMLFGSPPFSKQDLLVRFHQPRADALAANGGSLFSARFVPTTLWWYLRPDGIAIDRLFPWVSLRVPDHVFGDAVFESLKPTGSLTAMSPLAFAGAVVGTVRAVAVRADRAVWLPPIVGAAVGAVGTVALAFVDQRYEGDFLPLLIVPGLLGAWVVVAWVSARRRAVAVLVVAAAVLLGAWSVWANVATAYVYRRTDALFTTVDDRASLVETQLAVQDALGGGVPSRIGAGQALDREQVPEPGSLFVVGDCDGVFRSDGSRWTPVEQTPATGLDRISVSLDRGARGRQPVLSSVDDRGTTVIWARDVDGDRVAFDYQWVPAGTRRGSSGERAVVRRLGTVSRARDGAVEIAASVDHRDGVTPFLHLRVGGDVLADLEIAEPSGPFRLGAQSSLPGATELSGSVRRLPVETPLCDRLVGLGLELP